MLLAVIGMMMTVGMGAATNEFVAELDTEYTLTSGETYFFSFTAPDADVYVLKANIYAPRPYKDEDITEAATYTFSYGGDYGQMVEFSMEEGETFYFSSGNYGPWSDVTFIIVRSGSEGLSLESTSQDEGSELDIITNGGLLTLTFNMNVTLESAVLQSGVHTSELEAHISGVYVSFELRDIVYEWLNSGLISPGDAITLTITGLCASSDESIIYGDDGTLTLKYYAAEIPTQITESYVPETFLSYWIPDNEDGICVFVFDNLLATGDDQTATCTLTIGSSEEDDYYTETVPVEIEDSILTIDFTGTLRTKTTMGLYYSYSTMSMKLALVRDADGNLVYSSGQGTTGSFSYSMDYEEISSDITAEFTPANHESISDVDEIEIWLSDNTAVQYDGVNFASANIDITVDLDDITVTADVVGNGVALLVPVPDSAKTEDDVTVTLANVLYVDGIDHDISVLYNYVPKLVADFTPTTISPEGSTKSYVASVTTVQLTFDETAYINTAMDSAFIFTDLADNSIITATAKNATKDDKIVGITPTTALSDGHNYVLTIAQGAVGDAEYNETEFVYGRCIPQTELTYMINSSLASLEYITDPLDGASVSSLSEIKIYCTDIQGPTYHPDYGIYLYDADGTTVATGSLEDIPSTVDEQVITLSSTIVEAGTYTLEIQDSVFYIGAGSSISCNTPATFTYTVTGEDDVDVLIKMVSPEDGDSLEILSSGDYIQFSITSSVYEIGYSCYQINDVTSGEVYKTLAELTFDESDGLYKSEFVHDYELYEGHVYNVVTTVYKESSYGASNTVIGTDTFTLYGTAEEYVNSDITLESIEPEDESTIYWESDVTFTVTFSGLVNINSETSYIVYGQGITYPFSSITAVSNDTTTTNETIYASSWALVASSGILSIFDDGYVTLCIVAEDQNGHRVLGNEGDQDYTYFRFEYLVEESANTNDGALGSNHDDNWVTDPAEFSTLESLSRIAITDSKGVSMSPTYWGTGYLPLILNADGDTIRTIGNNDMTSSEYDWENWCGADSVIVTFEDITETGTYYLYVPAKAFTNDNWEYNDEMMFVYYIGSENDDSGSEDEDSGIYGITTSGDSAYEIEYYNLSGIRVEKPSSGVFIIRIKDYKGMITTKKVTLK